MARPMTKSKKETKKERREIPEYGIKFNWVNEDQDSTLIGICTVYVHHVQINGCRYILGKNSAFIAFPSTKGKDGKYYSNVYVDEEMLGFINEWAELALDADGYVYIPE